MRFLMLLILLAFPIMEITILIQLCQRYGWWVLVYLITIGYLGIQLIRSEKNLMAARMFQQMGVNGNPVATLFSAARTMFAGILLLIPGVITDAIAVILLILPARTGQASAHGHASHSPFGASANDDVIEGEFTEVSPPKPSAQVVRLPNQPKP